MTDHDRPVRHHLRRCARRAAVRGVPAVSSTSEYYGAFDEFLAERHAMRDEQMKLNYDYITHWETEHEEGLRGAFDAEQRDKEMDADGVAAEVIFPDADSITGMESPPFGAGLSAGMIEDPELAFAGARAHNRFLVELCATSPLRRGGVGLVPICARRRARRSPRSNGSRSTPGIRGIMIPTMWRDRTPYNDPCYDPVWAACEAANLPVHVHSGEAPREEMNDFIGIYLAEVVFWTHRPIAHLLFSGAFERFPGLKFVVTEGASYWVADMKWKWDQYLGGGHTTKKMAALMKGILSKLPSEYFGENIFVGASTMSKEEIRRRHSIGCDTVMWGTDYPHPEGTWPNTVERLRKDFGDVPGRATPARCSARPRRAATDSTSRRCGPIADKIGPTPEDLGQDLSLVTTPDDIRRGGVVEGRVPGAVGRLTSTPGGSARSG